MIETAKELKKVNGVDITRLEETMEALNADPSLAQFSFRVANRWLYGGHNRSTIKDFYGAGEEDKLRTATFVFDADEPEALLGGDQGANPVEYLLHALAACMTTSMVYHAAARGITIEQIESKLEGDLDLRGFLGLSEDVSPGYRSIRAQFKVKADASAEQLAELTRFSPVYDTVSRSVNIEKEVEIVQ